MEQQEKDSFRPRQGWTLDLGGKGMVGVHVPFHPLELSGLIPREFEAQTHQGQAYLSFFRGTLIHPAMQAEAETRLETPCMMTVLPIQNGELRGWLVLQIGIQNDTLRSQSERFLNLPLEKEGWEQPEAHMPRGLSMSLPTLPSLRFPTRVRGAVRTALFHAQRDSIDSFLTSQPNLLGRPQADSLQVGPVYLPPLPMQRLDLDQECTDRGVLAHFLDHWDMIAWRPQSVNLSLIQPHA
jgi:hypothetical protein